MSSGIQAFNEGYVKTVWQTGDVITAEKLNNMENGIENTIQTGVVYLKFAEEYDEANETYTYTLYEASMTTDEYSSMEEKPLALISIGEVVEPDIDEDEPYFSLGTKFLASLGNNNRQNFAVVDNAGNSPSGLHLYTISISDTWTLTYKFVELDS